MPTDVREVPWLWFEDNVSPSLLHNIAHSGQESVMDFTNLLVQRHTRSIAIADYDGMSAFLKYAASQLYSVSGS